MVIKKKKLFFNTVEVILEDAVIFDYIKNKNKYSRVSILTYKKLDLGKDWKIKHKFTPKIYLNDSLDEIFSRFNDTARNEVRRTFKMDDLTFKVNDDNFKDAYELYKNFEYAQGRVPFSSFALKDYKIFSVYYQNKMISAVFCTDCFPYLRVRSIFSQRLKIKNKELYKIIGYATRRLIYEVCKYGKERNYKWFDLASNNLIDPAKAGITQFKTGFGGKIEDEYTYIYKSKLFKIFEKLIRVKLLLYKIFRV